ncbi:DUF3108 domain-containing protein [Alteromonas sp. 5E99-2]|nr:DUF3108 domain-containing protein [Alteromonas sp. 5E99-2]
MLVSSLCTADTAMLSQFKAEYTAYKWGDPLGKATMALTKLEDGQYSLDYTSDVSKFFLSDKRSEKSIFSFIDGHFTPHKYHYSRTGTGNKQSLDVKFDANTQKIEILKNKDSYQLDWQGETDNQLYRLMLSLGLANSKKVFDVDFINYRGDKKHYNIAIEQTEKVDLPYGSINAIKVKINRTSSSRETFAWFAPELDYQLVRLQQFKDEKEQGDIKLSKYTLLPTL